MRFRAFVFVILTVSCRSPLNKNEKIYDEFQLIIYNNYSNLLSAIEKYEPVYEISIGDTLVLTEQMLLLNKYDDSTIYLGEGYYLPERSRIIVTDVVSQYVTIRSETDSIGFLNTAFLKENISDGSYLMKFKTEIDNVINKSDENVNALRVKYGMTDLEFLNIITEEHYKRTGN